MRMAGSIAYPFMKVVHSFLLLILLFLVVNAKAAYFTNLPYRITQPDGTSIDCFVSGDEYFNWIHDAEGYTLIQGRDGYYYYAVLSDGNVIPSQWKVNEADPGTQGLTRWVKISNKEYQSRKQKMLSGNSKAPSTPFEGQVNNLAIFIRFADDSEFTQNRVLFDQEFNQPDGISMKNYYQEVSYNLLSISSTLYPTCAITSNYSYQDSHVRNYFEPYNATSNPAGYVDEDDRTFREHSLVRDAVEWINLHSPVPATLDIDADNDGLVDNISFMVRGANGGWSSILWAHSWTENSFNVQINGKLVYRYTFIPESQATVNVMCHEMFHSLGAPDLYHYENTALQPVGTWDLMEQGFGHMGAYMKWKYTAHHWISAIPEISQSGTYSLNPLTSPGGNCYKIRSPYTISEYFVLEYRSKTGYYENNLPGSGLLVYRINPSFIGNSSGPPDEVYLYRPNGTVNINGIPSQANFSLETGRTIINDTTNPYLCLTNGTPGGINIYNVSLTGGTISFSVDLTTTMKPSGLLASGSGAHSTMLSWSPNGLDQPVLLAYSTQPIIGNPRMYIHYQPGDALPGGAIVLYSGTDTVFSQTDLQTNTLYYYKLWSVGEGFRYSTGVEANCYTFCESASFPFTESFTTQYMPNCWEVQQDDPEAQVWRIANTSYAGGSPFELYASPSFSNVGYTRMVLPPMNTVGITKLAMQFKFSLISYFMGGTVRLQTSSDKVNWTDEAWSISSSMTGNSISDTVNTFITTNLYQPVTYIAFLIEGQVYAVGVLYLDDFLIEIEECDFYQIHASSDPPGAGVVSGGGNYYPGQPITLNAVSNPGWNFTGWIDDGDTLSFLPQYTFYADRDHTLSASFSNTRVNIVAQAEPAGTGSFTGDGLHVPFEMVELEAIPDDDHEFDRWTENGQTICTTAAYGFTALSNRYLTAHFTTRHYEVGLQPSPAAGGACTGAGTYEKHSVVSLQANPNEGYQFSGWFENNTLVSALAEYSFEVLDDHYLEARFYCPSCQIEAVSNPPEGGTVEGSGYFSSGHEVVLTATANTGFVFNDWTENGTHITSSTLYSFMLDQSRYLVANFLRQLNVSIVADPPGSGIVVGEGQYIEGQGVTLAAFPSTGFEFLAWMEGGDTLSHESQLYFTITSNRSLKAIFRKAIGVPDFHAGEILILPNPAYTTVNIDLPVGSSGQLKQIRLITSAGLSCFPEIHRHGDHKVQFEVANLSAGMYTLVLEFSMGNVYRKLVICH